MPSLFVTGATGFLGRAFLRHLEREASGWRVVALRRSGAPEVGPPAGADEVVAGRLEDVAAWEASLSGVDTVVHLAARTGKASARAHLETNTEGTRRLLDAARRAGVRRFLFVSTIAATYADKRAYPYAESKERAEELVRESGLFHAILRPTIVLGSGAPLGASLRSLAGAPVVPVFGDGRTRVQPVHVDDVAAALAELVRRLQAGSVVEGAFDLGGPEVVTFEELLVRLARALKGRDPRVVRLPVRALIAGLAAVEPVLRPVLPVTAGQLSAFVHDGVVREGRLWKELAPGQRGLDAMLAELAADA